MRFKEKVMSTKKTISRSARKTVSFLMKVGGLDNNEAALRALDDRLSEALVDTFPASDPVSSLRFD
jgi:hypothetical protein